ncbi:RNA polymerase sigma factor [Pedobacter metabolipauper]|uniref:RNA polymerase sigma-70 factor (ECF subfamily) n=1 Tax=Pedobacter metabolipauper TaxID=425513 RepID=A0A4R6SY59_9SPHI|nr:RNA polymerase sigma factor [Pedobacter metabolipauper]TDQ09642.1 RNA polymerase sigma-70 factor (ECF subfamily) [Pedobacter metabolipauper]
METVYIDKHVTLVNACKQGDRKAQFEIYKLYAKAMYAIALRVVNHEAEAEDVLQEAFLDAFSRIDTFREETTFGLWLKQIVINKSINLLRKRKAELVSIDGIDLADELDNDEEDLEFKVNEIKEAMEKLPDGYRVVLSLYLFEGYDHEEIAHILKISENTSRSQYMRAKVKLNSLLKERSLK